MRATWYSSLLGGIGFGSLSAFANPRYEFAWGPVLIVAFFLVTFFGVIGFPQMRDLYREQKRHGAGVFVTQLQPGMLRTHLLPIWGRMVTWFISTCVTVFVLQNSVQ
jgi:hypothetical protein